MVVVVAGDGRGTGKTSVACALLSAFREMQWSAVKLTHCHHRGERESCPCELHGTSFACDEENDGAASGDTSRFLRAGAKRAFWMRATDDGMQRALDALEVLRREDVPLLIESNEAASHGRNNLVLFVRNGPVQKLSAKAALRFADAVIDVVDAGDAKGAEENKIGSPLQFRVDRSTWWTAELNDFVSRRLSTYEQQKGAPEGAP